MVLKSFLSGLFYKKNLKNIMIFLITLIGLMLIFGNNNLVLSEGLTLIEAQAKHNQAITTASEKNNQYQKVENDYNNNDNRSGFTNIEPFEGQPSPTCGGQNNAQLISGFDVNGFVNGACLQSKYIAAQRKNNNNSNNYEVPTVFAHPSMTREQLIAQKESYKKGHFDVSRVKKSVDGGYFNIEEANYITDGDYSKRYN
jgi:hypothetical protein